MQRCFNKAIVGSIMGNIMEFYDFVIYGYLFIYLSSNFFPANNDIVSLLLAFCVFGVGYLTRPFGAIIFGYIGDKKGRKIALLYSIILITTATFLIGILPNYNAIGIFAPIILVVLRLLQGVAVSGEQAGAIVFAAEFLKMKKLGMISALMLSGVLFGVFIGCFCVFLCQKLLSTQDMVAWGWRLPFIFSAVLGFASLKFRLDLAESPAFNAIKNKVIGIPLLHLVRGSNLHNCSKMFALSIVFAVPMSFHNVYLPVYYAKIPIIGLSWGLLISCFGVLWIGSLAPIAGFLSEKIGYKRMIILGCSMLLVLGYPLSLLLDQKTITAIILSEIIFGLIIALITAPLFAVFVQAFPVELRYTGVAFTFNLGMAIFASLTPVVAIAFDQYFAVKGATGLLLSFAAFIGLISLGINYRMIVKFFQMLVCLNLRL